MQTLTRKFRIRNPFNPDEHYAQEVLISDSPQYDYTDSMWVAIDTEFLTLKVPYDRLCTIQIASPLPGNPQLQRVEIIWVWEKLLSGDTKELKDFLKSILKNKNLTILTHVFTADLTRLELLAGVAAKCQAFDTKVAAKIVMTNTDYHGMDDLITSLVNPMFTKDRRVTSSQWDLHPSAWEDKMAEYAMNDVIFLKPLQDRLTEMAERRGKLELLQDTMAIIPTISALYRSGYDERVLGY